MKSGTDRLQWGVTAVVSIVACTWRRPGNHWKTWSNLTGFPSNTYFLISQLSRLRLGGGGQMRWAKGRADRQEMSSRSQLLAGWGPAQASGGVWKGPPLTCPQPGAPRPHQRAHRGAAPLTRGFVPNARLQDISKGRGVLVGPHIWQLEASFRSTC